MTHEELVKHIRTFIARYPLQDPFDMMERKAFADNIAAEIKAYGDNRFNEALDKAADEAVLQLGDKHPALIDGYEIEDGVFIRLNKLSILSLKIPTS